MGYLLLVCTLSLVLNIYQVVYKSTSIMEDLFGRTMNPRTHLHDHVPLKHSDDSHLPPSELNQDDDYPNNVLLWPIIAVATWFVTWYRWLIYGYYPVYVLSVTDLGIKRPPPFSDTVPLAYQPPSVAREPWNRPEEHRTLGVFSNAAAARLTWLDAHQQAREFAGRRYKLAEHMCEKDDVMGATVVPEKLMGVMPPNADGDRGLAVTVQRLYLKHKRWQ